MLKHTLRVNGGLTTSELLNDLGGTSETITSLTNAAIDDDLIDHQAAHFVAGLLLGILRDDLAGHDQALGQNLALDLGNLGLHLNFLLLSGLGGSGGLVVLFGILAGGGLGVLLIILLRILATLGIILLSVRLRSFGCLNAILVIIIKIHFIIYDDDK